MRKTWQNFIFLPSILLFEKRKLQSIKVMEKPFSRMFCKTATAVLPSIYDRTFNKTKLKAHAVVYASKSDFTCW